MEFYDIYGTNLQIEDAGAILTNKLSIEFSKRESSYLGEYLAAGRTGSENFEISSNVDPLDGKPLKSEYSAYQTLIFVNCTKRSDYIQSLVESRDIVRLRHNGYD